MKTVTVHGRRFEPPKTEYPNFICTTCDCEFQVSNEDEVMARFLFKKKVKDLTTEKEELITIPFSICPECGAIAHGLMPIEQSKFYFVDHTSSVGGGPTIHITLHR